MSPEITPPYSEAEVFITNDDNGSCTVKIILSNDTFNDYVVSVARSRGKAVGETIAEALRLELFHLKTVDDPNRGIFVQHEDGFYKLKSA